MRSEFDPRMLHNEKNKRTNREGRCINSDGKLHMKRKQELHVHKIREPTGKGIREPTGKGGVSTVMANYEKGNRNCMYTKYKNQQGREYENQQGREVYQQ